MKASVGLAYAARQCLKMCLLAVVGDGFNNLQRHGEGIAALLQRNLRSATPTCGVNETEQFRPQRLLGFDLRLERQDAWNRVRNDAGGIERIVVDTRARVFADG